MLWIFLFIVHEVYSWYCILITYIEYEKLNTDRNGKNQNHNIMNYSTREIWITIYGNKHRNVVISICYNKVMKTLQKLLCTVDELKQLFRHVHLIVNCIHEITFIILWRLHKCNTCLLIYQHHEMLATTQKFKNNASGLCNKSYQQQIWSRSLIYHVIEL